MHRRLVCTVCLLAVSLRAHLDPLAELHQLPTAILSDGFYYIQVAEGEYRGKFLTLQTKEQDFVEKLFDAILVMSLVGGASARMSQYFLWSSLSSLYGMALGAAIATVGIMIISPFATKAHLAVSHSTPEGRRWEVVSNDAGHFELYQITLENSQIQRTKLCAKYTSNYDPQLRKEGNDSASHFLAKEVLNSPIWLRPGERMVHLSFTRPGPDGIYWLLTPDGHQVQTSATFVSTWKFTPRPLHVG